MYSCKKSPIVINKNDWAFFMLNTKNIKMKFLMIVLAIHKEIEIVFNKSNKIIYMQVEE